VHDVDVFDSCVLVHTRENTRRGLLRLDRVTAESPQDDHVGHELGSPVSLPLPAWAVAVETGRNEYFKGTFSGAVEVVIDS
jgi:hypothetical protein